MHPRDTKTGEEEVNAKGVTDTKRYNLQRERIKNRVSISYLAEQTGVDMESLAAYERGDGILPDDIVKKVERFLKEISYS